MPDPRRYYLTTPIFYPNGEPHIGHAYTDMVSDAIARFHRLNGEEVYFLTGTDEHGLKMQQAAEQLGITAQELADRNSERFRDLVQALGISPDDFIRTTEPRHHRSAQAIWQRMADAGHIYSGTYSGWYSVRQEGYFDESETTVGDDGVRREPLGSPVEWMEEESYFFRLSAFADKLLAHYEAHPDFILPAERRNEVASFVRGGLKDLSISRTTFQWGIKVPGTPDHVMYVWIDALTNYITGVGFPDEADPLWRFWPADLHVIGKDIVRFHAVYWPAFLMAAGIELPRRVFAHGFLFNRGEKMSKSVGNVIDPFSLAEHYGVDQMRYFFMREVPFGQDGTYSHEAIVNRINADLANDFGNLAQRSLSMIAKHCEAAVPAPGALTTDDRALLEAADALLETARGHMKTEGLHLVLAALWQVVGDANRYFAAQEPWALRKSDPERMKTVLYTTIEAVRQVAILAQAFMPTACTRMLDSLGVAADKRSFASLGEAGRLTPGSPLPAPVPVFPRHVEPETAEPPGQGNW